MINYRNKAGFLQITFIISLATLLSRVLGLIKQQYSIYLFGGGWEFDAYVAAFRIPNSLREIVAEGALLIAFIPVFSSILSKNGKDEAFDFANTIVNLVFYFTLLVVLASVFFSGYFMQIYHYNPDFLDATMLASNLFNIAMLFLPFLSLSAISMGILNSMGYFIISACGPVVSNIVFILILNGFHDYFGIYTLSYANILGALAFFILQIPALFRCGFTFSFAVKNTRLKEFLLLFFPLALSMGIPKLSNIISNVFSDSITGANTALTTGFFIIYFPISLFVLSTSAISLPVLVNAYIKNNIKKFRKLISNNLKISSIFTFPSVCGLMVMDFEIVRFIFSDMVLLFLSTKQHLLNGRLISDIAMTQFYFAPGIIAISFSLVLSRVFQSMKQTTILIYPAIISVIIHFLLMTLFIDYFHMPFYFIALSFSLANICSAAYLIVVTNFKLGGIDWIGNLRCLTKVFIASLIMLAFVLILKPLVQDIVFSFNLSLNNILSTLILIFAGAFSYSFSLYLLKEKEWIDIVHIFIKKITKKKFN